MVRRQLTDADRVWNRACCDEVESPNAGDRALAALLRLHGSILNGGVGHAFDLSAQDLNAGIAGFKFFGLDQLASLIEPHDGDREAEYNDRYYDAAGRNDSLIRRSFELIYSQHREWFAPLGS